MRSTFVLQSAAAVLAFAWFTLAVAHPLDAAAFVDATGDFLPTYLGPKDAALDVRFADVVIDPRAVPSR
jgi:hypothetical protein